MTDNAVIGNTGTQLDLQVDKTIPVSIQNSLKLVVGNRKQEFKLADATFAGGRTTARWKGVSIHGWRETAKVPVSLVRANAPLQLSVSENDGGLYLNWQLLTGLAPNNDGITLDVQLTSSATVSDYAAASGSNMATGWVKHAATGSEVYLSQVRTVTGLVNGRKYRVRVRVGERDGNTRSAYGAWAFASGTPRATPPVIVRTPDAGCLTGLEIKGVKPDGSKTEALPLSGTLVNHVGLGPPGAFYAIRVPVNLGVKKVEVTPTWTNTAALSTGASTSSLTSNLPTNWVLASPWTSSGTARELLLAPDSGVTLIVLTYVATSGCGDGGGEYRIYAYHDNFATTANDRLRNLQLNAGN